MSKKSATKAERLHMSRVAALGCVVCRNLGYGPTPCELHHPRRGTGLARRAGHDQVIGLCPAHHRTGGLGVALHAGLASWEANFGSEAELLAQTRQELRELEQYLV